MLNNKFDNVVINNVTINAKKQEETKNNMNESKKEKMKSNEKKIKNDNKINQIISGLPMQ